MLIGIVKKNGILQIDKTNELRREGAKRDAAILEANFTRLRPILMTTVMLMAAMIPIAMGQGPGASARASMAKVIIGGQSLCRHDRLLDPRPRAALAISRLAKHRKTLMRLSRCGL